MEPNNNESIKLFHQNVQGISNCVNNLNVILSGLKVDFVVLTEHWQSADRIKAYQLENYTMASFHCRTAKLAHGGVVLYCADFLRPIIRQDINSLSEDYVFECTAAEFKVDNVYYVICVVYKPPNTKTDEFLNKLDQLLDTATADDKYVIVAGDFNIDMLPLQKNVRDINLVKNVLNVYNMKFTVDIPTRGTNTSKTC